MPSHYAANIPGHGPREPLSRRRLIKAGASAGLGAAALAALGNNPPLASAHVQEATATIDHECTGSITWAIETDPVNLLPFSGVTSNMWGKEFMYDSLLKWDRDLNIQPALAESFQAAPDATSYTFTLRRGVTFHNGAEMTARDVKYSLDLAVNPPESGLKSLYLANVAGTEVIDDYTVRVNMTQPDPTLPGVLAWTRLTGVIPEGIADEVNLLSEGIGTGPFKLVEFVPNDRVVYTCFPDHWQPGVPCVKDLTITVMTDEQARVAALRSGEIDGCTLSADIAQTLEGDDNLTVLSGLFSAPRVIQINTATDVPWRDARVRQAVSKTIDRQEIIDNVYAGAAVVTGSIPPGYGDWPLSNDELQQYYAVDVSEAKQLMQDAGYADGFDVTLQAISAPREYTQIAEIIAEQAKQLNINVTVQPLEIGTFAQNLTDGTYEWASTGAGMRGDPSGFFVNFRSGTSDFETRFGDGWQSEELDQRYDEALATSDPAVRHEKYRRIQQIIAEEAISIYSVQPKKFQVVRNRVDGMYVAYTDFNTGLRQACVTGE